MSPPPRWQTLDPADLALEGLPAGFLWGAATSAHQVEGINVASDAWEREHAGTGFYHEPSMDGCDS